MTIRIRRRQSNGQMVRIKRILTICGAASWLFTANALALPPGAHSAHRAVAQRTATFEVYKDRGGKFRWRLKAVNGQVIATSGEGYADKSACLGGIESVRRNALTAKIEEK